VKLSLVEFRRSVPAAPCSAVQALQEHPETSLVYGDALSIDQLGQPINQLILGDWGFLI
jgi:hypothetical protein